jgi:hypothetical protein
LTDFQTFFSYFHVFQVVEHIADNFRTNKVLKNFFKKYRKNSIFVNFCQFSIWYFLNLHALRYPNSKTFRLTSPSAWCVPFCAQYFFSTTHLTSIKKSLFICAQKLIYYYPVHLASWLEDMGFWLSKTERYCLSRICFEMTRQVTKTCCVVNRAFKTMFGRLIMAFCCKS